MGTEVLLALQNFFFHFQYVGYSAGTPLRTVGLFSFSVHWMPAGAPAKGGPWKWEKHSTEKVLYIVLMWESSVTIPCLSFSLALNCTQTGSAPRVDARILRGSFSILPPLLRLLCLFFLQFQLLIPSSKMGPCVCFPRLGSGRSTFGVFHLYRCC